MSSFPFPDNALFRHAEVRDVPFIHELICSYAKEHILLPRTVEDITERIGNFYVLELGKKVVACTALRDYGNALYEIRSLAVSKEYLNRRFGSAMVAALIRKFQDESKHACLFALTYREKFFLHLGFKTVDKTLFPEKIWSDCVTCAKKDRCDEIAVMLSV